MQEEGRFRAGLLRNPHMGRAVSPLWASGTDLVGIEEVVPVIAFLRKAGDASCLPKGRNELLRRDHQRQHEVGACGSSSRVDRSVTVFRGGLQVEERE